MSLRTAATSFEPKRSHVMSRADFDEFVQRKQEEEKVASFDPEQQLREWLHYLDVLYVEVAEFLSSYIKAGTARLEFREIELNEEFSGPYEIQQLLLHIGSSTITFKPIGTMLIGSKGRVDVQGPRGSARLSLIDKKVTHARQLIHVRISSAGNSPPESTSKPDKIEWVWKIITPAPEMKFVEFTEDSFFDMILGVVDA